MTVNAKINTALKKFNIPITSDFYGEGKKEYFTFDYASDRAAEFGDNQPISVVVSMQIHYFLPMDKNYITIKKQIRKALYDAGFTYPEVTHLTEPDGNVRHLIFECEIENEDELM